MLDLTVQGKTHAVTEIEDFEITLDGVRLTVDFLVPLRVAVTERPSTIRFSVYDREYYTSVEYSGSYPLSVLNGEGIDVEYRIVAEPGKTYYYGQVTPDAFAVTMKRSPTS